MRDLTYPAVIATAKTGFRVLGQRFQMTGTENVPRSGGVLLAYNHIGYVDFVYGGLATQSSGRLDLGKVCASLVQAAAARSPQE